jgi:lipopolysaccharide/colanic/teichoic acid biosynthesis glycosyltransferase
MLSQARRELLESLNVPISKADLTQLKRQQQRRIASWERNMKQLLLIKRALDILLSATAILMFSPLFILVGLCIYIENPGPIFYMQTRVGLNGRTFPFYKFRSMVMNADQMKDELMDQNESGGGVIFKMKKDPRVTKIGRFIRRFSIDEMPQFLNVLIGDLSIVGPRPPVPREVAEYTLEDRKRLHVKPGLTCFWQIQGRSEIPFDEQVRLDLQYIRSSGPKSDLAIMFKTVPAVLFGKGAY